MNPENPFFLISTLCGVIFLITAFIVLRFPPKKINGLYGYRTTRSMSSQSNWDFAQRFSTIRMLEGGVLMTVLGLAGLFLPPVNEALELGLSMLLLFGACGYILYSTEKALKSRES